MKGRKLAEEFGEWVGAETHEDAALAVSGTATVETTTTHSTPKAAVAAFIQMAQSLENATTAQQVTQALLQSLLLMGISTRVMLFREEDSSLHCDADSNPEEVDYAKTLVQSALRTRQQVLLDGPKDLQRVAQDTYIAAHKPASLLCYPLIHGHVMTLIYLENRVTSGVFVGRQEQIVHSLATQATFAWDNLLLRHHLEDIVTKRAKLLEAASAQAVVEQRQKSEAQMAGGFAHEMRNALSAACYALPLLAKNPYYEGDEEESVYARIAADLATLAAQGALPETLALLHDSNALLQELTREIAKGLARGQTITEQILDYAKASHLVAGAESVDLHLVSSDILQTRSPLG